MVTGEELRAARDKLVEDCAFASDGEVARLTMFAVQALLTKVADMIDGAGEKPSIAMRIDTEEDVDRLFQAEPDPYMTVDDAAAATGITAGRIYWAIRKYDLPHHRVGVRIRIRKSTVEEHFKVGEL